METSAWRSTVTVSSSCRPKARAVRLNAGQRPVDTTRPISSCRCPWPDLTWPMREHPIIVSHYDNRRRTTKRSADDWCVSTPNIVEHSVRLVRLSSAVRKWHADIGLQLSRRTVVWKKTQGQGKHCTDTINQREDEPRSAMQLVARLPRIMTLRTVSRRCIGRTLSSA